MINKVTFTGIDNKTNLNDLIILQQEYPFVEYGMLISENNTNNDTNPRYPSLRILDGLEKGMLNLSLHVCGKLARDIVQYNNWEPVYKMMGTYMDLFSRIQLNVAGTRKISKDLTFPEDKDIIIQLTQNKLDIYETYKEPPHICGFQDASGGRGIVSCGWMKTQDIYFGYAGGINEENVLNVIQEINAVNSNDFWIDMESSIRTDDIFDIEICRKICMLISEKNKKEV